MASQTQYLEWHGQQWRVRVKVPARLRDLIGRSKLVHPLHTDSLKEANERKWVIVHGLKAIIIAAEKALASSDPLEAEALQLRLSKDDEGTQYGAYLRAEQIEQSHGPDRATAFYALASGQVTPLDHHADAFIEHKGYRLKSADDFKRVLEWLGDWLRDSNLSVAINGMALSLAWSTPALRDPTAPVTSSVDGNTVTLSPNLMPPLVLAATLRHHAPAEDERGSRTHGC